MTKIDCLIPIVQSELATFKKFFNHALKTNIPLLNIITRYILRAKSNEQLTPIVILTAKDNGKISQSTYVAATLIKLLHTASAVHNDVRDSIYPNRFFSSIKSLWQAKLAVLMGDYLLSRGLLLAIKYNEFKLLEIISSAVKKISEGEILFQDVLPEEHFTVDKYIEIITKKPAAIMAASFICGYLSAGAGDAELERMKRAGINFGISCQIKDDISLYSKRNALRKISHGDSLKSLFNLPYIYALNQSGLKYFAHQKNLLTNAKLTREEQKEIISFVSESKGLSFARERMHHYKNLALQDLEELSTSNNRGKLKECISTTINTC